MPFSDVSEALKKHPNLKKYSAKARRGWVSAFNSAMESGKGESYAFAVAYSAANKVDGKKNINQKKSSLRFASIRDALQYLSDYTGFRVVVAETIDLSKTLDQVKKMKDLPIDEFYDDIQEMQEAMKDEINTRAQMENPTPADEAMEVFLDHTEKKTEEYIKEVENALDLDNESEDFAQELERSVDLYQEAQKQILDQQKEVIEKQSIITTG